MEEVEIKFEPSGRNGVIAVGTYLSDAARRLGVEIVDEFNGEGEYEADVVKIIAGGDLLSEPTKIEMDHLTSQGREKGERLAGQTRIEKSGEIIVMVAEKVETEAEKEEAKVRDFKKEFAEMPLQKKVANLLEMEAVTLSETFSFVFNSPFKIFEMGMDVLAEFGLKIEAEAKKAKRPGEHRAEEAEKAATGKTSEKNGTKKSSAGKAGKKNEAETATVETENN